MKNMHYAKPIEGKEFQERVDALRAKMAQQGIDIVVGYSNLPEIAIVIPEIFKQAVTAKVV